jgi:hypothetical protein
MAENPRATLERGVRMLHPRRTPDQVLDLEIEIFKSRHDRRALVRLFHYAKTLVSHNLDGTEAMNINYICIYLSTPQHAVAARRQHRHAPAINIDK